MQPVLSVFACFHATLPDYHLYIYGVGLDVEMLKSYVNSACLSSYVTLMGLLKESIDDHEIGLLAPMGDYNALASAMSEFADNPQLAKKCGMNTKKV